MKNLFLTTLLSISALVSCTDNNKKEDKKSVKAPKLESVDPNKLRIAYYMSDSLKTDYIYYKNEDLRITKKGEAFQNQMKSYENTIQNKMMTYEKYAKEGTVGGAELQSLEISINKLREQYVNFQNTKGAELEKETSEILKILNNRIELAGKKYCEKHNIDMLLIHGQGGQINFMSPKMNVTKSFIEFLNAENDAIQKEIKETK